MFKKTPTQDQSIISESVEKACCGDDNKYRALFMASRDAVMTLEGPSWRFTSGNPATIEMFRAKDEAEFLSYEPWKLSPDFQPDGRASDKKAKEMIEKAMREGFNFFEWTHKRLNGENFFAEVLLSRVTYDGKAFLHAVVRDITERKKIEEKLKEKEESRLAAQNLEKFKLAVESAYDHVIITDAEGMILYANKSAERITGYTIGEIVGTKAGKLWGGLMDKDFYVKMWKVIKQDKKTFKGEIKNKRKNGQIYDAETSISPILDENGDVEFFVGIERDITEAKEIDRAKSEFVSLASHQLRTPLTAISWYLEEMLGEKNENLNKKQKEYLSEVQGSNQRMIDLVGALLNISRIELGTFAVVPKPTDLVELAENAIKDIDPQAKLKKIKIEKEYDKNLSKINIDPELISVVFQNFISNAIKYTPEGGKIIITIKKDGENVLVSVKDTGYGIPKDAQSQIFTKFYRADNARVHDPNGNGLGLYIVKAIIEKSSGKIWFESEENKGTTFFVSLSLGGAKSK